MIFLEYILENEMLSLRFSTLGAELLSARRGDFEYIWQGAPGLWREHAPLLFPICSHLTGDIYTYRGKTYAMALHGKKNLRWPTVGRIIFLFFCGMTKPPARSILFPFACV